MGRGAIVGGGMERLEGEIVFFTRKFIKKKIHDDTL